MSAVREGGYKNQSVDCIALSKCPAIGFIKTMQRERSAGHSFIHCIKSRCTQSQNGISVFIVRITNKTVWAKIFIVTCAECVMQDKQSYQWGWSNLQYPATLTASV